MNSNYYKKRLSFIKKRQSQLFNSIIKEKFLIEKLRQEDITWDSFLVDVEEKINKDLSKLDLKKTISDSIELIEFKEYNHSNSSQYQSNGSQYYDKKNYKLGLISDELIFDTFKNVANLMPISMGNYIEVIPNLDILIVSTCYSGINNEWKDLKKENSESRECVKNIISMAKEYNVKTVFLDIDSNFHSVFENPFNLAKDCEYVLTNDIARVRKYKRILNTDKVFHFENSINPTEYNPIGIYSVEKNNNPFFIDSKNDDEKYLRITEKMVKSIKNLNLKILSSDQKLNPILLKQFNYVVINDMTYHFNTPLSFHLLKSVANGNKVISAYNGNINNRLPSVFLINDNYELYYYLKTDEQKLDDNIVEGIRTVMHNYNSFKRFNQLLFYLGIEEPIENKSVLVVHNNVDPKILDNKYHSYPNIDFIHEENLDEHIIKQYDYITFFNEDINYGRYYIEDLVSGFIYTDSEFIAKSNTDSEVYQYTNSVKDPFLTLFCTKSLTIDEIKNKIFNNKRGFVIDNLGYEKQLNEKERTGLKNDKKVLSVIVPVYNNGKFLKYKCFNSLKRSSIFDKMEILLVDDGSTDLETLEIINEITNKYNNVKAYYFNDGGSGSASRPRNKGADLASCKYITYLDPDNEAINDAYAKMVEILNDNESVDMVVGNIIRSASDIRRIDYAKHIYNISDDGVADNTYELLKSTNLKVQSIQALVVKRDIIIKNNLKMVEGAAGQDTLFFQELLLNTQKVKALNLDVHIYYAAVDNSVTNTVGRKFYEKYYKVEIERFKFLQKNNLFELYIENKFPFYFTNWYLKKLCFVKKDELTQSLEIIWNIYEMYEPYIKKKNEVLLNFERLYNNKNFDQLLKFLIGYFKLS